MSEVAQATHSSPDGHIPQLRFPEFSGVWEEKKFDSLYPTVRNGFVGVATPYYVEEGVPYLQGKNIKSGAINRNGLVYINEYFHQKSKKSQLRKNDIVMVQSGHVGECAVITEEFEDTNCHALLISTPTHDIDSKFYINYFYSKCGRKKIHRITTGNTIKHILSSDLKIQIVSNPSYQEQQKIAAFLTVVDNKIEQLSKKQELLGEYKKGLMQQIFSQEIRFKADDGSEFPDWEEKRLGNLTKVVVGGTPSTSNKSYWNNGDIPWLSSGGINDGDVIKESKLITQKGLDNSSAKLMPEGTTLLAMTGATLGRVGYLLFETSGNQSVAGLMPNHNFYSKFLFYTLLKNKQTILSMAGGAAQAGVNKATIESFKFKFPIIEEQTKIANFLSSIDSKIEQVGNQLRESKQFKKALLQQMFV